LSCTPAQSAIAGRADVIADSPDALRAPTYRRWFGKPTVRIAWLAVIISLLHPPHGLGLPICWLHSTTGIPCPGCGLTRSMSCAVRGALTESWAYHPFGVLFLAFFVLVIVVSLLPRRRRLELARFLQRHHAPADALYFGLAAAFIIFGIARAATHIASAGWTLNAPFFAGT